MPSREWECSLLVYGAPYSINDMMRLYCAEGVVIRCACEGKAIVQDRKVEDSLIAGAAGMYSAWGFKSSR